MNFGNACVMLITNDFVFKENLVIQSLKFTFYLIQSKIFLKLSVILYFYFVSFYLYIYSPDPQD